MADDFDPEADFIPTPRRTKTKKTEAIRLLADIEFDGKDKMRAVLMEPRRHDKAAVNFHNNHSRKGSASMVWMHIWIDRGDANLNCSLFIYCRTHAL